MANFVRQDRERRYRITRIQSIQELWIVDDRRNSADQGRRRVWHSATENLHVNGESDRSHYSLNLLNHVRRCLRESDPNPVGARPGTENRINLGRCVVAKRDPDATCHDAAQ